MNRKFYSMEKSGETATLNIYGDITSWPWLESDVSASNLSQQLEAMADVSQIDVYINSYGGEVAEGLAIYNALRRHKAKVRTICDGFACSIASVIFMAGDERIMNESSLLMIHNAWTLASGNAEELRKQADDLEKITQASVAAYKAHSTLEEAEIKAMMDAETWILPEEAKEYGFATSIEKTDREKASQNAWLQLFNIVKAHRENVNDAEEPEDGLGDEEQDEEEETSEDETAEDDEETSEDEADDPGEDPSDEPADEETEEETEEDPAADEEKETAQKWSGFFNSILNM